MLLKGFKLQGITSRSLYIIQIGWSDTSLLMPNIDANKMQNQKPRWICEYANIIFGTGAWAASSYLRTADPETFWKNCTGCSVSVSRRSNGESEARIGCGGGAGGALGSTGCSASDNGAKTDPQTVSDLLTRIGAGRFRTPVNSLVNCVFLWEGGRYESESWHENDSL